MIFLSTIPTDPEVPFNCSDEKVIHGLAVAIFGGVSALVFNALMSSFSLFLAKDSFCFSVSTFLTLDFGLGLGFGLGLAFALLRFTDEALDLGFDLGFAFAFFATGFTEASELGFFVAWEVVAEFFFRVVVVLPVCAFGLDTGLSV